MAIRKIVTRSISDGAVSANDFGGVASSLSVTGASTLAAISASIASTATDVFIYDTRKDSDGGAWRKRTQHTSWYNETLNTATRGSRREFPAVAVIVSTATGVTIYDGDDASLPMWMVFNSGSGDVYMRSNIVALTMMNGLLVTAGGGSLDMFFTNFISEAYWFYTTSRYYNSNGGAIAKRNTVGTIHSVSEGGLASRTVYDVSATVLPNANIDQATGLPIPTVAAATAGGVCIVTNYFDIKTITASAGNSYVNSYSVSLTPDGYVTFPQDSSLSARGLFTIKVPVLDRTVVTDSSDITDKVAIYSGAAYTTSGARFNGAISNVARITDGLQAAADVYSAASTGLTLIKESPEGIIGNSVAGLTANIGYNYNTGWTGGQTKGIYLSDTTAETLTATELISNGTFDTTTTGWTAETGSISVVSATMQVTRSGGTGYVAYAPVTTVVGKNYVVSASINSVGSPGGLQVKTDTTANSGVVLTSINGPSTGNTAIVSCQFTATTTTSYVYITVDSNSTSVKVDNVSCRLADLDRCSSTKSAVAVYGTITKTAVGTGNDLVAYSGFSGSNYLQQPYNSNLDYGTGDFYYSVWAYTPSHTTENSIISRGMTTSTDGFVYLGTNGTGIVYCYVGGTQHTSSFTVGLNTWNHYVILRRGGIVSVCLNGIEQVLSGNNNSLTSSTPTLSILRIGHSAYSLSIPFTGSVALAKTASYAPSLDTIKKIYTDEREMFQVGAKACLYGTSNVITAVTIDPDTKRVHAGTSSGRSSFMGLTRVENTSTAVTTAISAANGMVVEQ